MSLFTKNIQMINIALSGLNVLSMKYTYLNANTTLGGWGAGGYDVITNIYINDILDNINADTDTSVKPILT